MQKTYYFVLQYASLIPVVYGIMHRRALDRALRLFLLYLTVSLTLTVIMTFLALNHINNLWLMNLSLPIYAGLVISVFAEWQKNAFLRRLMRFSVVFFFAVWLCEVTLGHRFFEFTFFAAPLEDMLFVGTACLAIYQSNKDAEYTVLDQPKFWIGSGVMLLFGGLFSIQVAGETLLRGPTATFKMTLLIIQPALNLGANMIFYGGYRCQVRR